MTVIDFLFKSISDYDPDHDPLARQDDREEHDLGRHVTKCALRYGDLKKSHVEITQQMQSTQKLLVGLIIFLVATKVIDVSLWTGLLK